MSKPAVVLLSGGLDSTTCLGIALDQGFEPVAASFNYGQRHRVELDAVERVLAHYKVQRHYRFDIGFFRAIGGSALTDDVAVPHSRSVDEMASGIPVTYVPARNLVFLSYALGLAERVGAADIFIGVNALDYSGYPDCRPEFIESFEHTANLAMKSGVEGVGIRIHAPLVHLHKAEIVQWGTRIGVPYQLTHSCYDPVGEGLACGHCDSCLLRLKGFAESGLVDPVQYAISAA